MRHLYLLRHATTEQSAPGGDAARQLTPAGLVDAGRVGEHLASWSPRPQRVLSSSATRVQQTLERVRRDAGTALAEASFEIEDALYLASARRILDLITGEADEIHNLLVIAHNPGLTDLAQSLIGSAEEDAVGCLARGFRPATLMALRFDAGRWADIRPGAGHLMRCTHAG